MSPTDQQRIEVERVQNLVTAFDWEIVSIDYEDGAINMKLRKEIPGVPAEETAGPG